MIVLFEVSSRVSPPYWSFEPRTIGQPIRDRVVPNPPPNIQNKTGNLEVEGLRTAAPGTYTSRKRQSSLCGKVIASAGTAIANYFQFKF